MTKCDCQPALAIVLLVAVMADAILALAVILSKTASDPTDGTGSPVAFSLDGGCDTLIPDASSLASFKASVRKQIASLLGIPGV